MKTKRKILPGQPGTKRLMEKYGDDLICVRYRYDETHMMAIKTVELVVEKTLWKKRPEKIRRDRTIYIRIDYGEIELGRKVREAGGFWNREKRYGKFLFPRF